MPQITTMGNAMVNTSFRCSTSTSSDDENQNAFFQPEDVLDGLDELMAYIEKCLAKATATYKAEENTSGVDCTASSRVASLIKKGRNLLNNVLKRFKNPPSKIMSGETRKVVIDVLKGASQIQWVGAGLSIVAYLLQKVDDAFANKEECVRLLRYMYGLARQIKQLKGHIPQEKLHDVAEFIFKGSFFCVSRMKSSRLSKFFYSAVDVEEIKSLQSELGQKYSDLTLEAVTELLNRIPLMLDPSQGEHPDAVGIHEARLEVTKLLGMDDRSTRAVVVYGVGGMGKTTLATAVFSSLNLQVYKFCYIVIKQDCSETDLKDLQQQILHDLFGKRLVLRDYREGQREISKASGKAASQPVFLFIDNALFGSDLGKLLPKDLSWMPKGSKMLVTTRNLSETDMLDQKDIITRSEYRMKPLPSAESKNLLLKKAFGNPDATFDSSSDIDGLVNVCGGIPLVLDLVGSRLHRDRDPNNLSSLNNTIEYFKNSLATGEGELIDKVVDVVYDSLRDHYKDAFLDIAAFFPNWERRIVSYIVGEMELKTLEDAALVKISNCRVQLHDVVLRRGRKLSESDRITDPQSLANILEDPQRLEKLKGIWLPWIVDDEPAFQLLAKHLDRMGNLRILCLTSGTTVSGVCTGKFENLRYLSVVKGQSSPMELNKLPRLAIFEGRIRSDNRFCDLPHSLRSLKVYDFQSLELDERFGNLVQLEELGLWQDKHYIRNLPESFGQLKSLCRLCLCNFRELICLPDSFGQLRNLKELNMIDCPKLFSLSCNFGQLKSLVYLRLRGCRSLQRLSDDFISLSCVAAIDASGCPVLEGNAVDQMIRLESLMMLDIKESPMLISRWEEVKDGHPLLVCTERFRNGRDRENMYNHSMSTALFDGTSRFVSVNGVVADWSSIVRPIRCLKKLALLLTCRDLCSSSNEEACEMVKKKIVDLSSEDFHIMYVGLMEQSEESIGKTLRHLSQGISGGASVCAWIAPDKKWKQLFGFSAYEMVWHWYASQGGVHTFIAHAHINVAQDKPQVQCLELKFPEEGEDDDDEVKGETNFEGDFASQFSTLLNIDRFLN